MSWTWETALYRIVCFLHWPGRWSNSGSQRRRHHENRCPDVWWFDHGARQILCIVKLCSIQTKYNYIYMMLSVPNKSITMNCVYQPNTIIHNKPMFNFFGPLSSHLYLFLYYVASSRSLRMQLVVNSGHESRWDILCMRIRKHKGFESSYIHFTVLCLHLRRFGDFHGNSYSEGRTFGWGNKIKWNS